MRAQAQKNGDGSYTVRVFHNHPAADSTDVLFPLDSESEQLALEYMNFKNAQEQSGPLSPATQAVVADLRAMDSNDQHEQLMETFVLKGSNAVVKAEPLGFNPFVEDAPVPAEEQEINATSPGTIKLPKE